MYLNAYSSAFANKSDINVSLYQHCTVQADDVNSCDMQQ